MFLKTRAKNSFVKILNSCFAKTALINIFAGPNRKDMRYIIYLLSVLLLVSSCASGGRKKHSEKRYDVWGLDISRHQHHVDWNEVIEKNKPHFVFLKATEGSMIQDPTFDKHRKKLESAGIPWGAYHFFGHRTTGKEQAKNFMETARLKKGNLMPVLDIEPHRFMTDPKKMVKEAKSFCREIKKEYGVNPIIYCSTNFYKTYLKNDFSPKQYNLWIADYRGEAPDLKWSIWQHTEKHKTRGIRGHVDRNVFAGDTGELKKLIIK